MGHARLQRLLQKLRDVFRIKLGRDEPARVLPLAINPAENTKPHRSPQRRYARAQREFIAKTIRELETVGAIYKNPASRWASPALAVPKPGTDKLRFTVDLRGPNSRTVPIISAMPHLKSHLQDTGGSTCFASVDLAHGYWQVALSQESQEMMSIQTPFGVYSSRRLLQGGSDSGNHFQAVLHEKLDGRVENLLQWLDGFLLHAAKEDQLLDQIENFLCVCSEIGLKLHAEKSTLFAKEAKFSGRIISADGIRFNSRHLDYLVGMHKPTVAHELQQLLCATNWMRSSIPNYAQTVAPLHELMEQAYSKAGSRTKRAVTKIPINMSWGAAHYTAFATIMKQLGATVTLSYPKPDHSMCLLTDASQTHWAAILTQIPDNQRRLGIEHQHLEPLSFLSGVFRGSATHWSTPEKEGFSIVEAIRRLDYLVTGRTVSIFTDHAKLVHMYEPIREESWYVSSHCKQSYALGDQAQRISLRCRKPPWRAQRLGRYADSIGC